MVDMAENLLSIYVYYRKILPWLNPSQKDETAINQQRWGGGE